MFHEHEQAYRRINNEMDLLNILTLLRQCQFMSLATLKDHQRKLIFGFHQYNIDIFANSTDSVLDGPYYQVGKVNSIAEFDPFSNDYDNLILQQITHQRLFIGETDSSSNGEDNFDDEDDRLNQYDPEQILRPSQIDPGESYTDNLDHQNEARLLGKSQQQRSKNKQGLTIN